MYDTSFIDPHLWHHGSSQMQIGQDAPMTGGPQVDLQLISVPI
jgi:hypothetical protein